MPDAHSKATIVSMAIIASALATLLHEGLGHGVTAALCGDVVTELTEQPPSVSSPGPMGGCSGDDCEPHRWKRGSLCVSHRRQASEPSLFPLDSCRVELASRSRVLLVLRDFWFRGLVSGDSGSSAPGDLARRHDNLWRGFVCAGGKASLQYPSIPLFRIAQPTILWADSPTLRRDSSAAPPPIDPARDSPALRLHHAGSLRWLVRPAVGGRSDAAFLYLSRISWYSKTGSGGSLRRYWQRLCRDTRQGDQICALGCGQVSPRSVDGTGKLESTRPALYSAWDRRGYFLFRRHPSTLLFCLCWRLFSSPR